MAANKKTFSGFVSPIKTKQTPETSHEEEKGLVDKQTLNLPGDNTRLQLAESDENVYETVVFTEEKRQRREELNSRIKAGLDAFIDVAAALIELQNERLYLETHSTFEAYCADVFGLKRRRAYQLIQAGSTVLSLMGSENPPELLPQIPSHASALSEVPENLQRQVWDEVVKDSHVTGKPISAKKIAETNERLSGKSPRVSSLKASKKKQSHATESDDEFSDHQAQLTAEVLKKSTQIDKEEGTEEPYEDNVDWSKALSKADSDSELEEQSDSLLQQDDESQIRADHISTIRTAIRESQGDQIQLIIKGEFLIQNELQTAWFSMRNTEPEFISADYTEVISYQEARQLGIV